MVTTWRQAEDALTAAVEYLAAMPDRERGFLLAGSRSCWPQVVRSERNWDFYLVDAADAPFDPSPALSRRMAAHVEAMLLGERAAINVLAERKPGHAGLVGLVVRMKRWPGVDGFTWQAVFRAKRGLIHDHRLGRAVPAASFDAYRKAYERAVGLVAARMDALGLAWEGAAGDDYAADSLCQV